MSADSLQKLIANHNLPAIAELRGYPQWVCWRLKEMASQDGSTKFTKPPVNPRMGGGASHSDPTTWGSFAQARVFAMTRKLPGVGFVLSENDEFTGIDCDKSRDKETGIFEPWLQTILDFKETYAEVSPSGTGVRLIARGKVDHATKCDPAHVEIYAKQRYLTITGDHIAGTPESIAPAPRTIAALVARAADFQARAKAEATAAQPEPVEPPKTTRDFNFIKRDGIQTDGIAPPKKPVNATGGRDFFRAVNDEAMDRLDG